MSLTLLTQNLLEASTATVTVSPAAASGKPVSRVYDRRKSLQYEGGSAAQTDIDADLASNLAVTAWAFLNHTATGVTVNLYGDTAVIGTNLRDSVAATGADWLRTFASLSMRYWRARIPVMGAAPKLGEYFLGTHYSIVTEPEYGSEEEQQGQVQIDTSPAGYDWAASKGSARYRLTYRWTGMPDTDWTSLKAAYDQTSQSVKFFPMIDNDGTVRWVRFEKDSLKRGRRFLSVNEVEVAFLEVLS